MPDGPKPTTENGAYRYWAFISYSTADRRWARWLHREIETYGIPAQFIGHPLPLGDAAPRRFFPLYHDRSEAAVSANLRGLLETALRESRYLIVICSPEAARSEWVNKEIEMFCELGRQDRIFPLVVGGQPNSGGTAECFPSALRKWVPAGADLSSAADGKRKAKLRLIAGMLGVSLENLERRDEQRRRKRRLWSAGIAAVVCAIFALLLWNATKATRRAGAAVSERDRQIYLSDMQSARHLWDGGDLAELGRMVARYEHPAAGDPRGFEWYYWRHLVATPDPASQVLPVAGARSVVFDRSGKRLGIVEADGMASVWNWAQGKQLYRLPSHVRAIEFLRDGSRVVTTPVSFFNKLEAMMDAGRIEVWDAASGRPVSKISVGPAPVASAAVSPDGTQILVNSGMTGGLQLRAFPSGEILHDFAGPPRAGPLGVMRGGENAPVTDMVWRDDGYFFATIHADGLIQIWGSRPNVHTGGDYLYAKFPPSQGAGASGFAFSPDGRLFASQSCGSTVLVGSDQLGGGGVKVWGISVASETGAIGLAHSRVAKEWMPHSMKAFLSEDRNSPLLLPSDPLVLLEKLNWGPGRFRPAFDAGGRRLFTTGERSVQMWDALSGKLLGELHRSGSAVAALATHEESAMLASVGSGSVTLSSIALRAARQVCASTKLFFGVSVSPDGTKVAAVVESDDGAALVIGQGVRYTRSLSNQLNMWEVTSGQELLATALVRSPLLQPWFSADGRTVGLGAEAWEVSTRQPTQALVVEVPDFEMKVVPSPDGRTVVRAMKSPQRMEIVRRDTGKISLLGEGTEEANSAFAFSPDSQLLAAAGRDRIVRFWRIEDAKALPSLPAQPDEISALAFSPDGRQLAIGRMDHTVEVWSVSERTLLARHTGQRREISAIAFFPDGRRIVSSSGLNRVQSPDAGDVHLWDPATGQLCLDLPTERHEICSGLAISPDGRRVFGATNDTRVVETDPLMMLNPQGELLPPKLPPRPVAGRILCWEAPEFER